MRTRQIQQRTQRDADEGRQGLTHPSTDDPRLCSKGSPSLWTPGNSHEPLCHELKQLRLHQLQLGGRQQDRVGPGRGGLGRGVCTGVTPYRSLACLVAGQPLAELCRDKGKEVSAKQCRKQGLAQKDPAKVGTHRRDLDKITTLHRMASTSRMKSRRQNATGQVCGSPKAGSSKMGTFRM